MFSWGTRDDFCRRVLNDFADHYPGVLEETQLWTSSESKWVRRASAVSFITSNAPHDVVKQDPSEAFAIVLRLLTGEDRHIQTGPGWTLKAASAYHPREVLQFVMENIDRMPRTSLRYAIGRLSKRIKQKAMSE